jgi:multidrug resistance efflux pump
MTAVPFRYTSLAVRAEGVSRRPWLALVATTVLAGWVAWAGLAQVSTSVVSRRARVRTVASPHELGAPITATLIGELPGVDSEVHAGDVLARFDDRDAALAVEQAAVELAAAREAVPALEGELAELDQALAEDVEHGGASRRRDSAEVRLSNVEVEHARRELDRARALRAAGVLSEAELVAARAEHERRVAIGGRERHGVAVAETARSRERHEREARRWSARQAVATAQARIAAAEVAHRVALERLERHTVRIPVDGRIGSVGELHPGAVVSGGAFLASVVPDGDLLVEADFGASDGAARIAAGMEARVRLLAYPAPRYGAARAHVRAVAVEARDDLVRAELAIDDAAGVPLRHGVSTTVEVIVERLTPAELLLREIGLWRDR